MMQCDKKFVFIFKLGHEKAYDGTDKKILTKMMLYRGFSPKSVCLVQSLLHKVSARVRINGSNREFFSRDMRQSDLASPILFNFVVTVFSMVLIKAARNNQISQLFRSCGRSGIISI
jgi:hypothetical protein